MEGIRSDVPLAEKLELFEKLLTENQNSVESVQQKMEQKNQEQPRKIETSFNDKINSITEKQDKIPTEIKNA